MNWCNKCCRWIPDDDCGGVHTCYDARKEHGLTEKDVERRKAQGYQYRDLIEGEKETPDVKGWPPPGALGERREVYGMRCTEGAEERRVAMKAKINGDGSLEVERAGKMRGMYCPYSADASGNRGFCGDWCPKFEEDTKYDDGSVPVAIVCGGPVYEIIADERPKETAHAAE